MNKAKIFGSVVAAFLLMVTFSYGAFATESEPADTGPDAIIEAGPEKLAVAESDMEQCYKIGQEMLGKYYDAIICGSEQKLDDYFSVPLLREYSWWKMEEKAVAVREHGYPHTMVSIDFSLLDSKVNSNYIYCQIAARLEYLNELAVEGSSMSGRGEVTKMLFIKTGDGYKIADWYNDGNSPYDYVIRGKDLEINDPDTWLKKSAVAVIEKCKKRYSDVMNWHHAPAVLVTTPEPPPTEEEESAPMAALTAFKRDAMVAYAIQNCVKDFPARGSSQVPSYRDFSEFSGSWDCTNFISHVMLSGGAPVYNDGRSGYASGWYYAGDSNRSTTWSKVDDFNSYVTNNALSGYYS